MKNAYLFANLLSCAGFEEALEVHGNLIEAFLFVDPEATRDKKPAVVLVFEDESLVVLDPASMQYAVSTDEEATAILQHLIRNVDKVSKTDVSSVLEALRNVTQ